MMPVLNLPFLLALMAIGYAVFLALWLLALRICRVKRRRPWAMLSLPCYVAVLLIWLFIAARPAAVFQRSLGFPPPKDVSQIQSQNWFLGDTGRTYLYFHADPATIQRIVARGMQPLAQGAGPPTNLNTNDAPDWWRPERPDKAIIYYGEFHGRDFMSEMEWLAYCPETKEAWFQFVGID